MRKSELLERCSLNFLEDLALRIGTLPRNHWIHEKYRLVNILSKKLDRIEADMVFKSYLLCLDPKKIADKLAPQQVSKISKGVKQFLACDEYLPEVIVGRHRCDLVGIRGNEVLAIEIKSARDNMRNALSQVEYYQLWAREVYLAYDYRHARRVDRLPFRELGVGLLEISNLCMVKLRRKPKRNTVDPETLFSLFTSKYLRRVGRLHKIPTTGRKKEVTKALSRALDKEKIDELLVNYLKSRAKVSREKATIESGQILRTCL